MAKVVFSLDGKETHIQCLKEDKMKDICNKFSSKINININFLYFLYNGNQINLELTFKEQVNSFDNNRNQMNKYITFTIVGFMISRDTMVGFKLRRNLKF